MSREAKLTSGIGVKTALNIQCTSTKDALTDRSLTSVTSAKQKKTTKTAKHKEQTRIAKTQQSHLRLLLMKSLECL